jgi:hypothetical protein
MKRFAILLLTGIFVLISVQTFSQEKKSSKTKKSKQKKEVRSSSKKDNLSNGSENATFETPVNADSKNDNNNSKTPAKTEISKDETASVTSKPLTINDIEGVSKPVVSDKPNGSINWTEQYIEAKGMSVIDNEKFKNPAQAKLMAQRGATVDAQRNLLEIIKGVNITSETTVKDMMASSDFIYSRIDGVVKGAQIIGEPVEKNGYIELKMRVPLYETNGIAPIVYDKTPELKNVSANNKPTETSVSSTTDNKIDNLTEGLTFKINGQKIDPSLFPVIVDEKNNLVFDLTKLYDQKTGKFPKILQAGETLMKEMGYEKGLNVINVIKSQTGKLVIDNESVKKVNWNKIGQIASKVGKFLLMLV